MRVCIIVLAFIFQILNAGFAIEQGSATLTFEEVLKQAKAQSYDIKIADFDIFIAKP